MVRSNGGLAMRRRFPVSADDSGGDPVECDGRSCRSCTAVAIANCIALSCCPCAVVNLLALTLVKAPYVVGRRCLGMLRRRRGFLRKRRVRDVAQNCEEEEEEKEEKVVVRLDAKPIERRGKEWGEMGILGIALGENKQDRGILGTGLGESRRDRGILGIGTEENGHDRLSSRLDHEKVWVEFYQIGHWGFGRVSFSTNPGRGSVGRERAE
ncbi:uncharacterized protein LOC109717287 [Ananas comosus]|uniref:Uncharacterized protein LOC109717287 n=1 Tax=Ananas comosus TaxID=4615 RepID=A0A199VEE5_ANACO|nr:uncharacterized protein LOC109717287 [Ananas comosus]OAY75246.1 hypothetical protein ACMD2_11138 [Ananas comosus]